MLTQWRNITLVILSIILIIGIIGCDLFDQEDNGDPTSPEYTPYHFYLYSIGLSNGNLGGRAGADAACAAARPSQYFYSAAFLSVSATDQVKDIVPAAFRDSIPVIGPLGQVSSTWNTLWNVGIERSLTEAGVIDVDQWTTGDWWSGSTDQGFVAAYTCHGWTDNTDRGWVGGRSTTAFIWIYDEPLSCLETAHRLCVAW